MFLQVYNNHARSLPAATDITISDTQENIYSPTLPIGPNQFAYRGGLVAGKAQCRRRARFGRRPDPGRAAAVQDPDRLARQPPARAEDRRSAATRRSRRRPSSTSSRAGARGASARTQAGLEHFARDRRGGSAAGAVFDEQHARRRCADAAPARTRRTRRRCCSLRFRALGSLRCSFRCCFPPRFARRGRARALQFGRAGLAGDRHAGDRRGGAGAVAHDADHQTPHACARRARSSRAGTGRVVVAQERRARPPPAVGDRRRDGRHLQRRRQHLALADRGRADVQFALDLRGGRQRALGRACDPRRVVEAERFGGRDQTRRAELDAERGEHRVARHGERQLERAAAFLAVGVVQA